MSMLTASSASSETGLKKARKIIASVSPTSLLNQDSKAIADLRNVCAVLASSRDHLKEKFPKSVLRDEAILRLDKVYNSTVSIMDLVERGEVDKKEVASYLSKATTRAQKLVKVYPKLLEAKSQAATKKQLDQETAAGPFDYYKSEDYTESNPGKVDTVMQLINKAGSAISEYQKYARQLPSTEADSLKLGDFVLQRMPIIALTNPVATNNEWDRGGFVTKSIGFYAVLENQLVLGIHTNRLKSKRMDPATYKTHVIEKLERETNQKLVVMGKPMGYKNAGYTYYWLVPERNVDQFRNRNSKALVINQWHFAFK